MSNNASNWTPDVKRIFIAALISLTSLNAMAQTMSPQADEAHKAALLCLYKYSVQLDDGVSNVDSIAKVVANSCVREGTHFVDVWTAGVNVDKKLILDKFLFTNINSASYFILKNRADKK